VTPRFALVGLLSLAALGIWPEWLPGWPDWGQEWELADLEQSLDVHPPVEVERWLYNPRQRTALGLEQLHAEGAEGVDPNQAADRAADRALGAFEAAARLAPDDRRVLFNTGTARLLADHGDAVAALEAAVAQPAGTAAGVPVPPPLPRAGLQRAWYNLGGARLADDDAAGAVDAYEEALRLDPSDADAKHNLEVALRRLDEARRRLLPPRESPGGQRPGEEDESDESGGTEPDERSGEDDEERGGRDPEGGDRDAESRMEEGPVFGRRPLQGFDDQADLTAAQAAALLEAVENLERRERRLQATREAARAGAEEEDW
jgi:tetratricopeptide (TPR) repeat protein